MQLLYVRQFRVWQCAVAELVSAPPCSLNFCARMCCRSKLWGSGAGGNSWLSRACIHCICWQLYGRELAISRCVTGLLLSVISGSRHFQEPEELRLNALQKEDVQPVHGCQGRAVISQGSQHLKASLGWSAQQAMQ